MTAKPDRAATPRVADRAEEEPVLPAAAGEDRDRGWGEDSDGRRSEDWYRRERPPHHE
jgi:hypothetical protein